MKSGSTYYGGVVWFKASFPVLMEGIAERPVQVEFELLSVDDVEYCFVGLVDEASFNNLVQGFVRQLLQVTVVVEVMMFDKGRYICKSLRVLATNNID